MGYKIIVALDGVSVKEALDTAAKLKNKVWGFKINDLLFEPNMISKLKKFGRVFADAKLYDIPSTVAHSVARLEKTGADMITVHASGGLEILRSAKKSAKHAKIIGVTILTSRNLADKKEFLKLVRDAEKAKLDGIVCSAHELKYLKNSKLLKIIPGIRPKWYDIKDDQGRTVAPLEAINLGADLIVIGRPISKSKNILKALGAIKLEINEK